MGIKNKGNSTFSMGQYKSNNSINLTNYSVASLRQSLSLIMAQRSNAVIGRLC